MYLLVIWVSSFVTSLFKSFLQIVQWMIFFPELIFRNYLYNLDMSPFWSDALETIPLTSTYLSYTPKHLDYLGDVSIICSCLFSTSPGAAFCHG